MAEEQRNYYLMRKHYDEYMRELEEWKNEGVTKEEAKQRIDRRVLADTDIDKVYGKDWEQNKVTNVEEIIQTKEKNETEATLENTKITEGTTNKAEDTKETEKLHKEKIKQDEKFNQELEKLENEKKKLQRKLAKTKIPKTFYIPTSKFEDLNNYFINKGRNISFSEQVNYAIDKLLNKEVNIELNTTGTELRKIIKEELENLSNNLFKYDFKTRKSNYAISYLLIFIMFRWFCDSKEDEERILYRLKEADEMGYKMSKETDISITMQNLAKQLKLM